MPDDRADHVDPADQLPCRASDIFSAGLSMELAVKTMFEPSACMKNDAIVTPKNVERMPLP